MIALIYDSVKQRERVLFIFAWLHFLVGRESAR